jgi:hypothetical protein
MGNIRDRLSRIENRLEALIEGSASRLFPGRMSAANLASLLVDAMHSGLQQDDQNLSWAPNMYVILCHPQEAEILSAHPALIGDLTQSLDEAGTSAGFMFSGRVIVRVEADPVLPLGAARVQAHNTLDELPQTSAVELPVLDAMEDFPASAYLIVDGTQIFSLRKPVVNIGRRADNDLIIEDQRVSRIHAQLRWVKGRYILFDLDSAGGTWINDVRVNQAALSPGDVLSLAGVPLVFGIEEEGADQTQELVFQD